MSFLKHPEGDQGALELLTFPSRPHDVHETSRRIYSHASQKRKVLLSVLFRTPNLTPLSSTGQGNSETRSFLGRRGDSAIERQPRAVSESILFGKPQLMPLSMTGQDSDRRGFTAEQTRAGARRFGEGGSSRQGTRQPSRKATDGPA